MKYLFCIKDEYGLRVNKFEDFKSDNIINKFESVLRGSEDLINYILIKDDTYGCDKHIYFDDTKQFIPDSRGCIYEYLKPLKFFNPGDIINFDN